MASANLSGLCLNYAFEGPKNAPILVLSNSLGSTLEMWAPQLPALLTRFRLLRYDTRGHGATDVSPGPYAIAQLGGDVIALLDHLQLDRVHFCGLSLGGLTGMWLAINHPQRIDRLALCNTAAKIGTAEIWTARMQAIRSQGMASVAAQVIERWFTPRYRSLHPALVEKMQAGIAATPAEGYAGCSAAIRDADLRDAIAAIRAPTLVIAGTHDPSTPAADGQFVAQRIAAARYLELDAAHLSNWEQADAFTAALVDFLTA